MSQQNTPPQDSGSGSSSNQQASNNSNNDRAPPPTFSKALPAPVIYDIIMKQATLKESKYNPRDALHPEVPLKDPNSKLALDNLTRLSLPYAQPWWLSPSSNPQGPPPDFSFVSNSCGGKAAIGLFAGGDAAGRESSHNSLFCRRCMSVGVDD